MILMSSMIAELSRYQFPQIGVGKENEPEDAFAGTGYVEDHEHLVRGQKNGHTFSVNPQERICGLCGLPSLEGTAL
jgi:hypothetical protein